MRSELKDNPRIVEVVASGHTLLGSVRTAGERVLIDDMDVRIPSHHEQVRRWGQVRLRLLSGEPAESVESEQPRRWDDLSADELGELAAGLSEGALDEFRVWAYKAADSGSEAATAVLRALR